MKSFVYAAPKAIAEATALLAGMGEKALPLAGGTDLVGLMKSRLVVPENLVDLKEIPNLSYIREEGAEVRIGATTTVAEVAASALLQKRYPLLTRAAGLVASTQIRNIGTLGGNLCQRPRCWYFRNGMTPCLRRDNTYCSAVLGENQYHAILGGAGCFYSYPGDLGPALMALGARAKVTGPKGSRVISLEEFYVLPARDVRRETALAPGEILEEVQIPAWPQSARGVYLKFRQRNVYDFAIASVALNLQLEGGLVRDLRLVLGAVAPVPWRALVAEAVLKGQKLTAELIDKAITAELANARPMSGNAYKVELVGQLIRQAVSAASA